MDMLTAHSPILAIAVPLLAAFLTPLVGTIQTMPAFGRHPAAIDMDLDDHGRVTGLF